MKKSDKLTVYIVGTAYSGSTLIGSALNSHSRMLYVGEINRIPAYIKQYNHSKHPASCTNCLITDQQCKIFSEKNIQKIGNMSPIKTFDYIRKITQKPIVIDGSKLIDWLRVSTSKDLSDQTKVIILTKNPVSYLQSCKQRGIEPLWAEANAWRDTYFDAMRTCSRLGLPCLVVRLEDFLRAPERVLRQVCGFVGEGFEKRMLEAKMPLHAIGGNPGAYLGYVDKKILVNRYEEMGQKEFDINPMRLKTKLVSKLQSRKNLRAIQNLTLETPGLIDIATQLGYVYSDFLD
ncbi:hypothetical protein H0W80_03340 [Candidatus Saccharibacteria bacterium]|nr:hypothetical protein [Candidatus Saccharibacteria bacterium]